MKKFNWFVFPLAFLIFQSSFVFAQANKKAEIKRIDAYEKTVEALTKNSKSPQLIFADASDYNENAKPKWRKFASEKALEKFRETSETYTIAYNWQKNGKIVASNFTLFSPSGDWAKYVFHYFREDGSLAKVESELKTFYGDLIVLQNIYFDNKGRILKKTLAYKDLQTGKPKKPAKDSFDASSSFINETDYYKQTRKLPFAHLLKKPK